MTSQPQEDLSLPEEPKQSSWLKRNAVRLLASLAIAGACVWLLRAGALPIWPEPAVLAKVSWPLVAVYALLYSVLHLVRAGRWYWLLAAIKPVPMRRVLGVAFIGFLAIVALPFRTGEMVRPVL